MTCWLMVLQALKVEEVRKMGEQYRAELKEKIDRKLETAREKRDANLANLQERIRKHVCLLNSSISYRFMCLYCHHQMCTV